MWLPVALLFGIVAALKAVEGSLPAYLDRTGMFPARLLAPIAVGIILLEALASLLLIWAITRRAGWIVAGSLSASFLVFHIAALAFGDVGSCDCLGVLKASKGDSSSHVLMSVICALLLAISIGGVNKPAQVSFSMKGAVNEM